MSLAEDYINKSGSFKQAPPPPKRGILKEVGRAVASPFVAASIIPEGAYRIGKGALKRDIAGTLAKGPTYAERFFGVGAGKAGAGQYANLSSAEKRMITAQAAQAPLMFYSSAAASSGKAATLGGRMLQGGLRAAKFAPIYGGLKTYEQGDIKNLPKNIATSAAISFGAGSLLAGAGYGVEKGLQNLKFAKMPVPQQPVAATPVMAGVGAKNRAIDAIDDPIAEKVVGKGTKGVMSKTAQLAAKKQESQQLQQTGAKLKPMNLNDGQVGQPSSLIPPIAPAKSQELSKTLSQSFDDSITQKNPSNQLIDDLGNITKGGQVKERTFGQRVKLSKNTPQEVKDLVGGSYIVKSNKVLQKDALRLIKTNIEAADDLAMNPRNAVDIEVGNQLISHYNAVGQHQKAADIANAMNKSLTESGQFIQAASLYDKSSPSGILRFAQGEVDKFNKLNPKKPIAIDDKKIASLMERAEGIQKMAEGRERNIATAELLDSVGDLIPTSGWKKAITLWKAGLLTSFRTHERNIVGNSLNAGGEIAKDPVATVVDMVLSTRTGERTKTATIQGLGKGAIQGKQAAKDVLFRGYDPERSVEKFDIKKVNWGEGKLGQLAKKYTDTVFKTLAAADKPFYKSAYVRSLYDQAGATAINAGKRGDKVFIENLVQNPTNKMLKTAAHDAEVAVFQQSTAAGNVLNSIKNQLKSKGEFAEAASEFFLPFTQVPSGVGAQLASYSPFGLAKGVLDATKVYVTKDSGLQRQASEQIGRGIVGSSILAIGSHLYKTGNMTGRFPDNAKEREQWKLEGKQENSIKVGGKWRKLSSIGPQASLLVTGAQLAESKEKGEAGILKTAGFAGNEFLDQPFIQGMSVPLDVLKDPERNAQKFINQSSGSIVPNVVKDIAKGTDPYKRESNTAFQSIQKGIPGLRNNLLPQRDVFGQPLPEEGGILGGMFDLFSSTTPKGDSVTEELRRLITAGETATPTRLQKNQTIAGQKIKLTPEQLNSLNASGGEKIKQAFEQVMQSTQYRNMSDENKRETLEKVIKDIRAVEKINIAREQGLVSDTDLANIKLTQSQRNVLSGGLPLIGTSSARSNQIEFLERMLENPNLNPEQKQDLEDAILMSIIGKTNFRKIKGVTTTKTGTTKKLAKYRPPRPRVKVTKAKIAKPNIKQVKLRKV
jgi:hypothetical protein